MSTPSFQPGVTIAGKYRLDRLLGRGGMGNVFAALNTVTGTQVAIKCLQRPLAEASQRVAREALSSARIGHPNVVDLHDVLSEGDRLCFVTEYLEGESLMSLLAREATSLPQLIKLLLGAMLGVAAAHRQGVIHGDLKPDNVFLAREGHEPRISAKVLDFGISKLRGVQDVARTEQGETGGAISYMPIEQLTASQDVDGRADVYAFGVMLYQAITGRLPYEADSYPLLIMKMMSEDPVPVGQLRPDVPARLAALVDAAIAKRREQRVATLDALISALEPFSDESGFDKRRVLTSRLPSLQRRVPLVESGAPHARIVSPPPLPQRNSSALLLSLLLLAGCSALGLVLWIARSSPGIDERGLAAREPHVDGSAQSTWTERSAIVSAPPIAAGGKGEQTAEQEPAGEGTAGPAHPPAVQALAAAEPGPTAQGASALEDEPAAREPNLSEPHASAAFAAPAMYEVASSIGSERTGSNMDDSAHASGEGARGSQRPMSAAAARPVRVRAVATTPALDTASVGARSGCSPTFYFDAQAVKHFKPECFQ